MKKNILLILLFILIAGGGWWASQKRNVTQEPGSAKEFTAPQFSLIDSADQPFAFPEKAFIQSNSTFVHFWATWCPPCIDELPQILKFAEEVLKPFQIPLILVNLDSSWEIAKKTLPEKLPAGVISLIDPKMQVSEKYGSYKFPETYWITKDLKIKGKWVGPQPWPQKMPKNVSDEPLVKMLSESLKN